jgi:hypothetical protein
MISFLLAVLVVCALLFTPLQSAFLANAPLNTMILGVFILGVAYNFRQVVRLYPEVAWIERYRQDGRGVMSEGREPRLLAPIVTMLGERHDRFRLSALSLRSLLDSISSRLDESRDISRYTVGLLIFLGLLGTFWGLLETVGSIRDVIGGLSAGGDNMANVFNDLKQGLEAPLGGMGTAFSSSLFGLAGSLVLGFLCRARHACRRAGRCLAKASNRFPLMFRRFSNRQRKALKICNASWRAAKKTAFPPTMLSHR